MLNIVRCLATETSLSLNTKNGPVPTLVTYRAKPGKEAELLPLVKGHWPLLKKLGLATATPAKIWRARGKDGRVAFVEIFEWKDQGSSDVAHQTPEVMAVWEPMGAIVDGLEIARIEAVA